MLRGVSRVEEGSVTAVLTAPEYMSVLDVGEADPYSVIHIQISVGEVLMAVHLRVQGYGGAPIFSAG